MHGVVGHSVSPLTVAPWPLEVTQLLEEHHVAAWSRSAVARDRFAADLGETLGKMDDTLVCTIDGARVVDLDSFCRELERGLGGERVERSVDGVEGVVNSLRRRPLVDGSYPVKRMYLLWREAHVLLKHEPKLFGRLADAIVGVAAEGEFVSDDVLFLQRAVFMGGASLDVYAEDPRGQLMSWYAEGGETPLWRVVTGLRGPSVARWKIAG